MSVAPRGGRERGAMEGVGGRGNSDAVHASGFNPSVIASEKSRPRSLMSIAQRYREWPRFQPAELQKRMVRSAKGPGLVAAPLLLLTPMHLSAWKVNSQKFILVVFLRGGRVYRGRRADGPSGSERATTTTREPPLIWARTKKRRACPEATRWTCLATRA